MFSITTKVKPTRIQAVEQPIQISTYVILHNVPKIAKNIPKHQNFKWGLNYDKDSVLTLNLTTHIEDDLYKYHRYIQVLITWLNLRKQSEQFENEVWEDISG
jgi:hypothetical protein